MNKDNEYHENAAESERMARLTRDKTDKRTWLNMAQHWRGLSSVPPGGGQKPEEALVNGSAFRAEPRIFDRRAGELMRFAESRAEQNLDHLNRLGQCRNLHDLLALQTQVVRDNLEAFLQSAQRTSERTTEVARTAVDRMSAPPTAPR